MIEGVIIIFIFIPPLFYGDCEFDYNEVYRRLARHSPRAEANNAIAYMIVVGLVFQQQESLTI